MNFLPLCTAIVCPTSSGITVDRRDQVLMTFFSVPRFITSIFSSSEVSTNGPFFSDLLITQAPKRLLLPALDDELVRRLAVAGLVALGRQPPRRHRVATAGRLSLATAERVIDRVHRDAPDVRPFAQP